MSGDGFVPDFQGATLKSGGTPKVALLYFHSPSAPDELAVSEAAASQPIDTA